MEQLSKSLLILSEKIKELLTSYSRLLEDNEILKNRISTLEFDVSALKYSLEEKKKLLEDKNQDVVFVSMVVDDLLEDISRLNHNDSLSVVLKNNKDNFNNLSENVFFDVKENSNHLVESL
jgi:hypothetical protein